jgi:hypothetical protein
MAANKWLSNRNRSPQDEFYTQLVDIEAELRHYKDQLRGQVVFCNCDDPYESNFFKYFAMNFHHLGLKKLVATAYSGSPITGEQLSLLDLPGVPKGTKPRAAHKLQISEVPDANGDGAVDLADVEYLLRSDANTLTLLGGGGDFRSEECVALLAEADLVVTNPPFSLFREYITQLAESGKKFALPGSLKRSSLVMYKPIRTMASSGESPDAIRSDRMKPFRHRSGGASRAIADTVAIWPSVVSPYWTRESRLRDQYGLKDVKISNIEAPRMTAAF